jgi:hypothetical protein
MAATNLLLGICYATQHLLKWEQKGVVTFQYFSCGLVIVEKGPDADYMPTWYASFSREELPMKSIFVVAIRAQVIQANETDYLSKKPLSRILCI